MGNFNVTMNVPKHVGIILDGNRRFAKRLMLKRWKGHEYGAEKIRKLLDWCKELDIREVTLYVFSIENFDRPKEEFDYLMKLFNSEFSKLIEDKRLKEDGVQINFIGRIHMFPKAVEEKMRRLMEITKNHSTYVLNFAMAYGGRAEVIDATRKIASQVAKGELDVEAINEEVFDKNVYMDSKPDLIIRTSGEKRLSGFLLWQGAYAEISFVDKFWPDFEKEDFLTCIQEYSLRDRRFGK